MSPSRRTVLIMMIQSFGVTGAVIAKQVTEAVLPVRVGNQTISIVMPYFMKEMSEQRAIAFLHLHAHLLTDGTVCFLYVEGDQAVGMTSGGQIALQIAARNSNTTFLIDGLGDDVKSQREQLCGQATLGRFCLEPAFRVFRNAESRNGPVQATGSAELSRIMLRKNVARRTGTWWSSECYANTGASGIERVPDILTRDTLSTSNSLREAGGNVGSSDGSECGGSVTHA